LAAIYRPLTTGQQNRPKSGRADWRGHRHPHPSGAITSASAHPHPADDEAGPDQHPARATGR